MNLLINNFKNKITTNAINMFYNYKFLNSTFILSLYGKKQLYMCLI